MADPRRYDREPTKRNVEYWAERYRELGELLQEKSDGYVRNVKKQFGESEKRIERHIKKLYDQLAASEGISQDAARRLLEKDELEAFHMSVWEYIELMEKQSVEFDPEVEKELERASVKVRVSRLEAIKTQLHAISNVAYNGVEDWVHDAALDSYKDSYYRSIFEITKGFGIGASFSKIDDGELELLLKRPWARDGSNFSDRVWTNKVKLKDDLPAVLTQALIEGQGYTEACRRMERRMSEEYYKCARIIVTESAYFTSLGQKDSWDELGVEEFEVVATLDRVTSEVCRSMDGKVFRMDEYEIGKTAPPFHPNCRTTTAPYFNDEDVPGYVEGTRAARDPKTGKTVHVPADLDYEEWEEVYVNGGGTRKSKPKPKKAKPIEVNVGRLGETFTDEEIGQIKDIVRAAPENMRNFWNKHADNFVAKPLKPTDKPTTAYFSNVTRAVHFNKERAVNGDSGRYPYETLFHECGHFMDFLAGGEDKNLYLSATEKDKRYGFAKTLQEEGTKVFRDWARKHPVLTKTGKVSMKTTQDPEVKELRRRFNKGEITMDEFLADDRVLDLMLELRGKEIVRNFRFEFPEGLSGYQKHGISDMFEWILPLTGNGFVDYPFDYGHGTDYWFNPKVRYAGGKEGRIKLYDGLNPADITDLHNPLLGDYALSRAATESFAHMCEAVFANPDSLEQIQKYFPEAYKIFLEMIDDSVQQT